MQKLQRMLDAVEGNLIRALVKHQQLEAAAIWDRSLKLAAQACSSRPDLLTQAIMRCYTKGGTRRGDACLLEEVAGLFIEGLVVHGSPLGNLPPVDSWPAPCLWSWEVDGSEYYPPQPNNGLAAYLGHINDERYRLEQHNAWMRFLKPVSTMLNFQRPVQQSRIYIAFKGFLLLHAFSKGLVALNFSEAPDAAPRFPQLYTR